MPDDTPVLDTIADMTAASIAHGAGWMTTS